MLLSPEDAELFFKLHKSLMCFVNERLEVIPGIDSPNAFSSLPPEIQAQIIDPDQRDVYETLVNAIRLREFVKPLKDLPPAQVDLFFAGVAEVYKKVFHKKV